MVGLRGHRCVSGQRGTTARAGGGATLRHWLPLADWKVAYPDLTWLQSLPKEFPWNRTQMSFAVALTAITVYVVLSLLSRRPPIDMDKLLHRGKYAVEIAGHHPSTQADNPLAPMPEPRGLTLREKIWRRLGVNDDFTRGDKAIYLFKIGWVMFFFIVFIFGTLTALFVDIPVSLWIQWWGFKVIVTVIVGIGFTIWLVIGGLRDLVDMVRTLKNVDRDADDDGHVSEKEHLQED